MRSLAFELVDPVGECSAKARRVFRWRAVPGAIRYQVRLMEVDHREIWRGEATDDFISIPAPVLALLAPGKKSSLGSTAPGTNPGKALGTSGTRELSDIPGFAVELGLA